MSYVTSLRLPAYGKTSPSSPASSTSPTTTERSETKGAFSTGRALKRERDPRLDFFRGVGMLIILLAHIPNDRWALWIPARFGFSDATEMFVFLSGMASAIAFGTTFDRNGASALIARTGQRIWQIYWAHVIVFIVVVALMTAVGTAPSGNSYLGQLNLIPFIEDPGELLVGLLTLRYVPNYFDILPMYIVILALLPVMLFAERVHRALPFVAMVGLWLLAQFGYARFSAEPWSDRQWFLNPFGWQLLFFTGFFIMRGSIQPPRRSRRLLALAVLCVVATVPFAWYILLDAEPFMRRIAVDLAPLTDKTQFGLLRFVHFSALAYIAVHVVGERGRRLKGPVVRAVSVVGQQSLAVFVTGMVLAQGIGIVLDAAGRGPLAEAAGNIAGFTGLIATAYLVGWFKTLPWRA